MTNRTHRWGFRSLVPFLLAGALNACGPTQSRVAAHEDDPKAVAGAISQILARPAERLILINGYPIDTDSPALTYERLPSHLRASDALGARFVSEGKSGLYLVQFVGPIQDAWLEELRTTGVRIISYVANNAYVVRATTADSARALSQLKAQHTAIRFLGNYEPGFRLAPALRSAASPLRSVPTKIVVQVINDEAAGATIDALRAIATDYSGNHEVLVFRNVYLTVESTRIDEIAQLEGVFAVEPHRERHRLDEVQGQILAGNVSGGLPTGPGYSSWLSARGFSSTQFSSFAVEVADDAYTLAGHLDLPSERIAFEHNPSKQSGDTGGHGFLNSHIIGGFNSGVGSPYQDENGFQYNMGIAPYARLGVTAIFGGTAAKSSHWEAEAYAKGARISSNSWGYDSRDYDIFAQEYDAVVRDTQRETEGHQPMVVVFAAGNSGRTGAASINSPGTAKNVITVGASENVRPWGPDGCGINAIGADNSDDVIAFSSRGPVDPEGGDGRFKPELMAPGTHVQGGVPSSNYSGATVCDRYYPAGQTLYGWSSGTSHSCPAVAGGAALVYQHFLNQNRPAPSPAMVKAYLLNATSHMTGVGGNDTLPSNSQGMGRMNLGRAFDDAGRILIDQTQVLGASGELYQVTGSIISASTPFRVTLAWSDAPGPTTAAPYVNNLDLEVTVGGITYRGNVFSGATSVPGGTADPRNNVESVFLPAGLAGSFVIRVRGTNIAGDGVPGNGDTTDQDFALVIYNANQEAPTRPYIGLGSGGLTFSGMAENGSPASQSFSIVNSGIGTLNWAVTSSAPWLTVTPSSGTAPSTLTVSVEAAGLTEGTYTADIAVSSPEAANSPAVLPVVLRLTPMGMALYEETWSAPACLVITKACTASAELLAGRDRLGPEPHAPNTIRHSCPDGSSGRFHVDESIDALSVATLDGTNFAPGKQVRIDATVFVYSPDTDWLDLYFAADAASPDWQFIATIQPRAAGSQVYSATYTLPQGGPRQAVRAAFRYKGEASWCTAGSYDDRDDLVFAVGASGENDVTAPTTAITSPEGSAEVSGTLTITADADDNVAVTHVEFYVDGRLLADDVSAPYSAPWPTTSEINGPHSLYTKAFDAAGNFAASTEVAVHVYNDSSAPLVALLSPDEGATVRGSVSVTAIAEDDNEVAQVEFLVDGAIIGASREPPYVTVWLTSGVSNGEHWLVARASDVAGNVRATDPVRVIVQNRAGQPAR